MITYNNYDNLFVYCINKVTIYFYGRILANMDLSSLKVKKGIIFLQFNSKNNLGMISF